MTLIITAIKNETIWQSSDNRISIKRLGQKPVFRDDNSIKHVTIECPNGTALLAWTGLAELPDYKRTKTSDWISEILRGETRNLNTTLEQIRHKASEEIGDYAFLLFSIAAFLDNKPYYYEITNGDGEKWQTKPLNKVFTLFTKEISKPEAHIGGGAMHHISRKDQDLLRRMLTVDGKPEDFGNILAGVNKRTSVHCDYCHKTVSSSCVTVYIQNMKEPVVRTTVTHLGESRIEKSLIPYVIRGVDTVEYMKGMMEVFQSFKNNISGDKLKKASEEVAKKAITPRLRKP